MNETSELTFKISAALKNIIGRDLINDKYIAVFELVKNSYDADARNVTISFRDIYSEHSKIIITDDGCGMNYQDIINKWLFVAYSEKKPKNKPKEGFRNKIKRNVAGAKGVGRFSCDRLCTKLTLYTKTLDDQVTNKVAIDWDKFELDDSQEFMEVKVDYSSMETMPNNSTQGTILVISNLRENWDRSAIISLKKSLMKLINPDVENSDDPFYIHIKAKEEIQNDEKVKGDREKVNGLITNDVFEKLNIKTTNISVSIASDGKSIETTLTDRGQFIFEIVEKNVIFDLLKDIRISLFYLNRSAKYSFTRTMGIEPVNYGSVFIYKNGFRIYPYGEPGEDFFNIDRRKIQGYNRYLGTREIMGRISINGENSDFVETTSRDGGFIRNPAIEMLNQLFTKKVLRVLERYVVNIISWGEPLKSDDSHIIMPNEVADKILSEFADVGKRNEILRIDYNPDILKNSDSVKENSIQGSVKKLEKVAIETQNPTIIDLARKLSERTDKLLDHNISLEKENREIDKALEKTVAEKQEREQQVYFLKGITDKKVDNLIGGMHSIFTLTESIKNNVDYLQKILFDNSPKRIKDKEEILGDINIANKKINKLSELAIKGSQALKQVGSNSIHDFIIQYINEGLTSKYINYKVVAEEKPYNCRFDTASIGVILDNISSNSLKANADQLNITISETDSYVILKFKDNGHGLNNDINPDILFEMGFSTTSAKNGFGIGLHHIKLLVEEMGGIVKVNTKNNDGFELVVTLLK